MKATLLLIISLFTCQISSREEIDGAAILDSIDSIVDISLDKQLVNCNFIDICNQSTYPNFTCDLVDECSRDCYKCSNFSSLDYLAQGKCIQENNSQLVCISSCTECE